MCDIVSQSLETFFHDPCDSKLLNIAVLKNNERQFNRVMVDYDAIQKKVICMPYERNYLLLPMKWKDDELGIIVSVYLSTLSQASCLDLEDVHIRNLMVNFIP